MNSHSSFHAKRCILAGLLVMTLLVGCGEAPSSSPRLATTNRPAKKPKVSKQNTPPTTPHVAPAASAKAQPKPKPTPKPKPKPKPTISLPELRRQQWLRAIPVLKKAEQRMRLVFVENQKQMEAAASTLVTEQGIETFIDNAIGMKSIWGSLQGNDHRDWIQKQFESHVVPIGRLKRIVLSYSETLDQQLAEIDTETLIAIQADVDLDPAALGVVQIDLNQISQQFGRLVNGVHESVNQSIGKSLSSLCLGMASFELAHGASREAMKDENGEISTLGALLSIGIGVAAEELTRSVADEALETRKEIGRDLRAASQSLLLHSTAKGPIRSQRAAAVTSHHSTLLGAIIRSLGVDPIWAFNTYKRTTS